MLYLVKMRIIKSLDGINLDESCLRRVNSITFYMTFAQETKYEKQIKAMKSVNSKVLTNKMKKQIPLMGVSKQEQN